MHCLLKWLGTESSKNCCPMDRRPWGALPTVRPHRAPLTRHAATAEQKSIKTEPLSSDAMS
jgi:hypothetical protein